MNEELKIVISADTKEAEKNIQEASEEIENIKKVSKEASEELDGFTKTLTEQGKELKELKVKYMDVVAAQGENSDEAKALAKQIQDLSSEYYDNSKKAQELADMANSLDKGFTEAEKAAKELAEETERMAQEQKEAAEKADKLAKEQKEAAEQAKELEQKQKEAADASKELGDMFTTAAAAMTGALVAIGGALVGITNSTEETRKNQALLQTAFEAAGGSANVAKDTYNDLYRVLGDDGQATEAAQHLAKLTTNQEALAEWTETCQGIYATFGASLPIESLTEAANETAKTGTLTGALADALNWAGIAEEEFQERLDLCNTEAEREALIRDTLNNTYRDAAYAYEENAAAILEQNDANLKMQDSLNAIGDAMQPIKAMFTELSGEVLGRVAEAIQDFVNEHGEELRLFLEVVGEMVGNIITFIVENIEPLGKLAIAIGVIATAINIVSTALKLYTICQTLANSSMGAAVIAIAAVAAAITLIVIYWDDIVEAVDAAIMAIMDACEKLGKWFSELAANIKNAFGDMGQFFRDKFTDAKNNITSAFSSIGNWFRDIKNSIASTFSDISAKLTSPFQNAIDRIKSVFTPIKSFFADIYNSLKATFDNIGTKITDGLTRGVKNAINAVLSKAVDVINGAIAGINGAIEFINMIPGVNLSRISEMSVPKLAKGGVVNSATLAMVGEAGAEMVLPLENNLGYLDKLATMLTERMGGGNQPIILQVDGKTFAEISCDNINKLTRQRGSLPLVMA